MVQTESLPSTRTFREKVWEERLGTAGVWKSHFRSYTREGKLSSRVVRDWHYTPRFNVSQMLNVVVSRCAVISEWPCSMLSHSQNWEGIITITSFDLLLISFVLKNKLKIVYLTNWIDPCSNGLPYWTPLFFEIFSGMDEIFACIFSQKTGPQKYVMLAYTDQIPFWQ